MKFIVCYLMGNCEKNMDMSLNSVKDVADEIVVVYDTSSKDNTKKKLDEWKKELGDKLIILEREYQHGYEFKNANSDARSFYLKHLQEHNDGDYVLVLDADEVADDNLNKLKKMIMDLPKTQQHIISPKMIHLIQDLAHEDYTNEKHYVLNRLFRINDSLCYPNGEHPVLQTTNKDTIVSQYDDCVIYHMAYVYPLYFIKERYLNHLNKSEIHNKDFLDSWYYAHITGSYPKRNFDITKLPSHIKKEFMIDDDYFYFGSRKQMELKHIVDAYTWKDFFELQGHNILNCGDGMGHRTKACQDVGITGFGFDISEWAVKNTPYKDIYLTVNSITTKPKDEECGSFRLVTAYDLLEHLTKDEIKVALQNMHNWTNKYILISVPVIGDPNLLADDDHKTFENMDWWKQQVTDANFTILPTPDNFIYRHQLIIAEKNDK